jgi:hypothetical protein
VPLVQLFTTDPQEPFIGVGVADTVTVVLEVAEPCEFVAVRVYEVVCVGDTD